MLTEYEVRKSVDDIAVSEMQPMRKVRSLLRVARIIKAQARALLHARALSAQANDCNTSAHMDRIIRSLRSLYDDVRLVAHRFFSVPDAGSRFSSALA